MYNQHRRPQVMLRMSPRGDWIASLYLPKHPAEKWHGWCSRRFATPHAAADWLGEAVKHHLPLRALYNQTQRERLRAAALAAAGKGKA